MWSRALSTWLLPAEVRLRGRSDFNSRCAVESDQPSETPQTEDATAPLYLKLLANGEHLGVPSKPSSLHDMRDRNVVTPDKHLDEACPLLDLQKPRLANRDGPVNKFGLHNTHAVNVCCAPNEPPMMAPQERLQLLAANASKPRA